MTGGHSIRREPLAQGEADRQQQVSSLSHLNKQDPSGLSLFVRITIAKPPLFKIAQIIPRRFGHPRLACIPNPESLQCLTYRPSRSKELQANTITSRGCSDTVRKAFTYTCLGASFSVTSEGLTSVHWALQFTRQDVELVIPLQWEICKLLATIEPKILTDRPKLVSQ